jgi:hypothetical protein
MWHAGDEVSFGCWSSNAGVRAWMQANGMGSNLTRLNNYYMQRLLVIISSLNKTAMFWRPGAADSLPQDTIPKGTIFDVYGGFYPPPKGPPGAPTGNYSSTASITTASGHRVVRSSGLYLDQLCDADPDGKHQGTYWGYFQGWTYYRPDHDPLANFSTELGGRPELVIGGKANM